MLNSAWSLLHRTSEARFAALVVPAFLLICSGIAATNTAAADPAGKATAEKPVVEKPVADGKKATAGEPIDLVIGTPQGPTEQLAASEAESLLKHLIREGMAFTISADMSRELRAVCCGRDVKWEPFEERASEVVDLADVEFIPGNWWKGAQPLRYVALRFSARQGRLFGDGSETKYLAVVSNRRAMKKRALVRWHWQKAGTVEHTHNVTKNDLGGRLPPSGLFGANAAWYRLTMLTYNILTVLKREGLPERLLDARPKRLRYEVFTVPAEIREHGRQTTARLGAPPLTVKELIAARRRLLAFGEALRSRLGA